MAKFKPGDTLIVVDGKYLGHDLGKKLKIEKIGSHPQIKQMNVYWFDKGTYFYISKMDETSILCSKAAEAIYG